MPKMINASKPSVVWERHVRRVIVLPFLTALLFSLVPIVSAPSPLASTTLRLDPATIELGPECCIGETFTLAAKIDNVEYLTGVGIQIKWNTTYIEHVSHIITIPVENYPEGVLHEPILSGADKVDNTKGTYDCAVTTLGGPSFNGSGTIFEITFKVKAQPIAPESDAHFQVKYTLDDLADLWACGCIPHYLEHCNVTIHSNPQLTLSVDSSPSEVSFIAEDSSHTTPWFGVYGQGCPVYLMMPETCIHDDVTYHWDRWSDGYEYRTRMVSMMNDTTLTAIYKTSPLVGGTSISIDLGKFSSWITSTLLLVAIVITLNVKWNRRRRKQ